MNNGQLVNNEAIEMVEKISGFTLWLIWTILLITTASIASYIAKKEGKDLHIGKIILTIGLLSVVGYGIIYTMMQYL